MDLSIMQLDKASKISLSQQIADLIQKNIENKNLLPGDKLPTERELADVLQVARGTVKAAYKRLEQNGTIETRKGSGSYILLDEEISLLIQKKDAQDLINQLLDKLQSMGWRKNQIDALFHDCLTKDEQKISVAIIFDNPEILLDMQKQISYLKAVSISIFILESFTTDVDPERLLSNFDLIITPSKYYQTIIDLLPNYTDKLIEAAVSPNQNTLINISSLPRNSRIGIICRTNVFLSIVKDTLISFGFLEKNIQSFFEMEYTTSTYFPGGIDALISFGDAHIFTDPAFTHRNKELIDRGGRIIQFDYHIEKGTLIYIEDLIHALLKSKNTGTQPHNAIN